MRFFKKLLLPVIVPLLLLSVAGGILSQDQTHTLEQLWRVWQSPEKKQTIQALSAQVLGTTDTRGWPQAVVERVVDGDTIVLSTGETVRLIGMDSPELHHPQKPKQCFGEEALRSLQTKVEGKVVQLEKDVSETDKYHRLLRYVWIDNELVNETQVRTGVAFARSFPPDIARQATLLNAERLARSEQVGLWSGCQVDIKKKSTQPVKVQ